jgi:hypothetical protein
MFNRPLTTNTPILIKENQRPSLNASHEDITLEEIKSIIKKLKNHKTTGHGNISGEIIKGSR